MAQLDTGLGWSANEGFLRSVPGRLVDFHAFGGASFPGQPLPIMSSSASAADVIAGGLLLYEIPSTGWNRKIVAASLGPEIVVFNCYTGTGTRNLDLRFVSGTSMRNAVRLITYNTVTGAIVVDRKLDTTTAVPNHAGLYYIRVQEGWGPNPASTFTSYVPYFSSDTAGYNAIVVANQTVYKLAAGASVAVVATWNNIENERVSAPILISSAAEYTTMSLDGSTETPGSLTGLRWQNRTFQMRILLGLDGDPTNYAVNPADLTAAFPGAINITTLFEALCRLANITVTATPDPYGDDAQPGGGEGNPDEDEDIDFSTPPPVGSYVGFFRMWNPTETELRQLASWMWSSQNDLEFLKKLFSAPIESILGLSMVPVQPDGIGGYTIVLGGVDTGISAFTVTNRYVTVNCGSIAVEERWGAYLDYSPFTKMSIFLPYIGFRDISTDDVMGKTVALQYNVDVLSGACVAELKCGGSVLYSWQGNCAQQMPITAADWSAAFSSALGLAGTAAAAIVTKGGTLPLGGTVASSAVNALSMKPHMARGGSISGAAGAMAGQVPYLVRERPEQAVPGRQNHYIGYPSFTTVTLGSVAGYTEVESIHLEGIPATAAELSELESILKEGFIL